MNTGLKNSMDDSIYGRAEAFLRPGYFKEHVPNSSIEMICVIFRDCENSCIAK